MIDYEFYTDSNVTTCVVLLHGCDTGTSDDLGISEYVGTARRDPNDRKNPDIGRGLALSRALQKASTALYKHANGKVKQSDHVAQDRLRRQAEDPDGSLARAATAKYQDLTLGNEIWECLVSFGGADMSLEPDSMSLGEFADWSEERAMAAETDWPEAIHDSINEDIAGEDNERGDR